MSRNFGFRVGQDSEAAARIGEQASVADFFPKLTPRYDRSPSESIFAVEAKQKLPWSGGSLDVVGASHKPGPESLSTAFNEWSLRISQPLLRGFGPTVSNFDQRISRRALAMQERALELARQQLAIDVTTAFCQVVQQRQLLEVARQSLQRSESLRNASEA